MDIAVFLGALGLALLLIGMPAIALILFCHVAILIFVSAMIVEEETGEN